MKLEENLTLIIQV